MKGAYCFKGGEPLDETWLLATDYSQLISTQTKSSTEQLPLLF